MVSISTKLKGYSGGDCSKKAKIFIRARGAASGDSIEVERESKKQKYHSFSSCNHQDQYTGFT
jgi:hypothetical protein